MNLSSVDATHFEENKLEEERFLIIDREGS